MNRIIKSALLLTVLFATQMAFSQKVGMVKFFVDVDNGYFEIELNDTMLLKRYKDTLPVGSYTASVWSPGYIVTQVSFDIVEGKTTEQHVKMAKNNNYIQYELDYKQYRNQFHKQFTVPLTLSLVSALTSGMFMVNTYTHKKAINTNIELYHKSPSTLEIAGIKSSIIESNKKYNFNRNAFYINTGITFALIGGTIWSYINFNKNYTEPTFNKDSPFRDKYSLNITPYGCTLALKL